MYRKFLIATACAAVLVPATASAAVVNGGFETRDFTGWTQIGSTAFNGVLCGGLGNVSSCAAFFGPIGSTGGITQSLATTIGQQYSITFAYAADGTSPSSLLATFGGVTLLSLANPSANAGYVTFTGNANATATSTLLSFTFRDDPGFFLLDSIAVTPTTSGVPEPTTWALMVVGFAMAGASLRRRQATRVHFA